MHEFVQEYSASFRIWEQETPSFYCFLQKKSIFYAFPYGVTVYVVSVLY